MIIGSREMSFFQDAIAIFKKRDLVLVDSYKESEDIYSFLFEKEKDLTWKAGQHGLFTITDKKVKNATRPFTVASAPNENVVRLTMRIGDNPSDFKKAMLELEKGMAIKMSGPVGNFYIKDENPTLLIAGGIGITPFRAILKQMEAEGYNGDQPIQLLYLDSKKTFVFKDELDALANNSLINVTYLESKNDLQQEIDEFTAINKSNGNYFIAGPKSMVDSISTHIQNQNVPKRNIKKDAFYGY